MATIPVVEFGERRGGCGILAPVRPDLSLPRRVERRNAAFQQWEALLTNRRKRNQTGQLLVQGVRPISAALASSDHRVLALLKDGRARPSDWARETLASHGGRCAVVDVAPELMAELGERSDGIPELLALVELPADDVSRLPDELRGPVVVFDRPANPGNIGTLARSVDALGGSALIVTGHAADPWDPAAVRASTGSIFGIPVLRLPSHQPVLDWAERRRSRGEQVTVVGTDEHGEVPLTEVPTEGTTIVVIGSEATGMSSGWREACDLLTAIPMTGTASSLNAASAGSIVLYELMRRTERRAQRQASRR